MFDFGFSEILVIAVVMLIVVGPERLPKVARTAGYLLGRMQRYVSDVKTDIQREMQIEDLKKLQQQVEQQARDLETSMRGQVAAVEEDLGRTAAEVRAVASPAAPAPVDALPPSVPASAAVVPPAAAAASAAPSAPSIPPVVSGPGATLDAAREPAAGVPRQPVEKA